MGCRCLAWLLRLPTQVLASATGWPWKVLAIECGTSVVVGLVLAGDGLPYNPYVPSQYTEASDKVKPEKS